MSPSTSIILSPRVVPTRGGVYKFIVEYEGPSDAVGEVDKVDEDVSTGVRDVEGLIVSRIGPETIGIGERVCDGELNDVSAGLGVDLDGSN